MDEQALDYHVAMEITLRSADLRENPLALDRDPHSLVPVDGPKPAFPPSGPAATLPYASIDAGNRLVDVDMEGNATLTTQQTKGTDYPSARL